MQSIPVVVVSFANAAFLAQAWRMLTRSFLPPDDAKRLLIYSPMFHARLFQEHAKNRSQVFQPTRASIGQGNDESPYLDGNPSIDRPLFVQFCANSPDEFLASAQLVAPYCDAVDLNLGCPQGIARKGHYGAFLQEDWDSIYKLINKLHAELSIPVTAKFRIQESKEKTLEYARMILSAGASIICVHGRQREQKGHNTGIADWSYIRYLRDNLPPETVIFANGNILNHDDLERCIEGTGADAVMSAEGNLSDPAIFSKPPPLECKEYWRGRNGKGGYRIDAVFRRYMDVIYQYVLETPHPERRPLYVPTDSTIDHEKAITEEEKSQSDAMQDDTPPKKKQKRDKSKRTKTNSPSLVVMQGHLFQLLRPMISKYTNIRDALARSRPGDIPAFEHVLGLVEEAIKEGLQEYEQHPERFENGPDVGQLSRSKATIAQYGRPWWICQPHIRPLPDEAVEKGALHLKKKKKGGPLADAVDHSPPQLERPASTIATEESSAEPVLVSG